MAHSLPLGTCIKLRDEKKIVASNIKIENIPQQYMQFEMYFLYVKPNH